MLDIKTVADAALPVLQGLLHQWLPAGRLRGHEYMVGSIAGEPGESMSVNIRSGRWSDFASGESGGDAVSLYAALHKISQLQAARELGAMLGINDETPVARSAVVSEAVRKQQQAATNEDFQQALPDAPATGIRHFRLGEPSRIWEYRTRTGKLIGYVCRFDKPEGGKEVLPYSYWRCLRDFQVGKKQFKAGQRYWRWLSFADPRPLYNLPALEDKAKTVLVVEGEKAADHAAKLFPDFAVVSWPGGGKAVHKASWKPLAGRTVLISPDADEPGFKTAHDIAETLRDLGCDIRFVVPEPGAPEGWDLADCALPPEQALTWLRNRTRDALGNYEETLDSSPPEMDAPPPALPADDYPDYHAPDELDIGTPFVFDNAPFRCVGYDKDFFYYFARGKQQIVSLTAAGHTTNNLMQLASRFWWKSEFPKGKSDGFDLEAATDALMRGCERAGIFSVERIRGRGAWYDAGRVVVHLGDRVIIDGDQSAPASVDSAYVYEAAEPITADLTNPLTNRDANQVIKLFEMLPWERPIMARLAAGWCVVSHIGGVMRWRPHIWIVGRKGSGKTYVMSNIVRPLMGRNCLFVQGGSSEAGIRQQLGGDSLPVMFDEAEGEDTAAHANIQRILGLIRQSSSETGGKIAKGTPSGRAQRFMIRSSFALSSINANLVQASDKSRVSVLELNRDCAVYNFDDIVAEEQALLTDEFCGRFYARAIRLAGVIRENAVTFARAAAAELGEQRAGDQIGALLAGCYALYSDKVISFEAAREWVAQQDWSEAKQDIHSESDEVALLQHILQHKVRVRLDGIASDEDLPVGVLVEIARNIKVHSSLTFTSAATHLMRIGLRVERDGIFVSNTSTHLKKILERTHWATGWGRVLRRLPNARPAEKPIYFGFQGSESRAVFIPHGDS